MTAPESTILFALAGLNITIPRLVIGIGVFMLIAERFSPGRNWPRVNGWWARALLLNGCQVGSVYMAGFLWDDWLSRLRPWSADGLGIAGGALAGYLAMTFVYYWWHYWRHRSPLLWRWLHQVHHSPQRIEVITSFYKHPFELIANGILSSVILYLVVGLGPVAAPQAVLLSGIAELFYHWNVPTPYWLGFIIQRPESHCMHHQEGLHYYNFGDLPLWDMLFGTFRNPRAWNLSCGFAEKEARLSEMLLGIDVNQTVNA
jgi:sterol desaturase/sphingolipid hydroxylase (fatty acid hydroxylase superfamily)